MRLRDVAFMFWARLAKRWHSGRVLCRGALKYNAYLLRDKHSAARRLDGSGETNLRNNR